MSVRVTDPLGAITTLNATTDVNGSAKVTYALKTPGSVKGVYAVSSVATKGSTSGAATKSFSVQ